MSSGSGLVSASSSSRRRRRLVWCSISAWVRLSARVGSAARTGHERQQELFFGVLVRQQVAVEIGEEVPGAGQIRVVGGEGVGDGAYPFDQGTDRLVLGVQPARGGQVGGRQGHGVGA